MEIRGAALASRLNNLIDDMSGDRVDNVEKVAVAGGISTSTMNQILSGSINCPPLSRLQGFARILQVSVSSLTSAAETDGCEYDDRGQPKNCTLRTKSARKARLVLSMIKLDIEGY